MSGWYLRGDIGYRWNGGGPSAATRSPDEKYSDAVAGTFGFGYKYQWFRADLIYDRGTATNASATTTRGGNTAAIHRQDLARSRCWRTAYIDFGTWAGFTPMSAPASACPG